VLANFDGENGAYPYYVALVQGLDGNFYGTTSGGGTGIGGTVFKITPSGALSTLYSFCPQFPCLDGSNPPAGLELGTDGYFYGVTTSGGGGNGGGTIFQITPGGELTTLYNFQINSDGAFPLGRLVQGLDGNFYGTTSTAGNFGCDSGAGCGTVFRLAPDDALATLHAFAGTLDGATPRAGLIQGTDGNFYGTAAYGGFYTGLCSRGCGSIFRITPWGAFETLHLFTGADGALPFAALAQGTDGNFYGTTTYGTGLAGTVFRMTPEGKLTTLYSFCAQPNCTDGAYPDAGLVQATDGNFYGTTEGGGANGAGTVFDITPAGLLTTLHSFTFSDGANPTGRLVQGTDGMFYGTTPNGGTDFSGTIYSLSVGLGPFIGMLPVSSRVGKSINILGTNLTGATALTFNGTPASFTVVSASQISTTVPAGATTGAVQVTTPSGALASKVPFRVTPLIKQFSPSSGNPGTVVTIDGESFTGAARVTFGGVPAKFTVNSYTEITATVPGGAKTGKIDVTTPGGEAISAQNFRVN
jgi:uncharacterized repeat protein (TIGR03803 family)